MKLTDIHIQELYTFTRQHFVEHYDVQTELVDHLANDIEAILAEKPTLSFEEARDISFKKFGVFGFMHVVEAKQKQMNKRYRKILWRFFSEWFTMPQLLTTVAIFAALFVILQLPYSGYILLAILFVFVVVDLKSQQKSWKKAKQKKKNNEKVFLLEAMIGQTKNGLSGLLFLNVLQIYTTVEVSFNHLATHWLLLISASLTVLSLFFYTLFYVIPKKSKRLLQETYPEYKLAKSL